MPDVSQTVLDWMKAELDGKDREIERLRAALQEIADLRYECGDSECGAEYIAREALEDGDKNENRS